MKKKFPIAVAIITLILVFASIVCTFVGAFLKDGAALFKTGIFGMVAFPIVGWLMISSFRRVHPELDPFAGPTKPEVTGAESDAAVSADEEEMPGK